MTSTRIGRASLATLLAAVLALAGAAVASGAIKLSVTSPHQAKLGKQFQYLVKGSGPKDAQLQTFLNTKKKCSKTLSAERNGPFGGTGAAPETLNGGPFKVHYQVTPRSTGKHYICAYLYKGNSLQTLAKAHAVYVTK